MANSVKSAAAIMGQLPSLTNVSNDYAGLSPAPGHSPSAWEQASNDALNDQVSTALGASPAIQALRRAADERRYQGVQDELTHQADLSSGRPGDIALQEAGIEGNAGNVLSHLHAQGQFDPAVAALHARDQGDKLALAKEQYEAGPTIAGQAHVAATEAEATGRVNAAVAGKQTAMTPKDALRAALLKRFETDSTYGIDKLLPDLDKVEKQYGGNGAGGPQGPQR